MDSEPIPKGTRVAYHGGNTEMHGEYTVEKDYTFAGEEVYDLWPVGVPYKFGLRHLALTRVRRRSLTVREAEGDNEAVAYTWTDASAVWQAKSGTKGTRTTHSAWLYIEDRMAGSYPEDANRTANDEDLLEPDEED